MIESSTGRSWDFLAPVGMREKFVPKQRSSRTKGSADFGTENTERAARKRLAPYQILRKTASEHSYRLAGLLVMLLPINCGLFLIWDHTLHLGFYYMKSRTTLAHTQHTQHAHTHTHTHFGQLRESSQSAAPLRAHRGTTAMALIALRRCSSNSDPNLALPGSLNGMCLTRLLICVWFGVLFCSVPFVKWF